MRWRRASYCPNDLPVYGFDRHTQYRSRKRFGSSGENTVNPQRKSARSALQWPLAILPENEVKRMVGTWGTRGGSGQRQSLLDSGKPVSGFNLAFSARSI
jgi:hypothetical protein